VTVKTIAELEGTIELRVIEPIYSSETSIGSSRVTILGADVYGGAAVFDESYWQVRRNSAYTLGRTSCYARRERRAELRPFRKLDILLTSGQLWPPAS
jgi:hypothetical protein